jgi:sec-independent protein translocase protein TatB
VFNLQGSEIIFILLLALVVLGPEKLPGAVKRAMQTYAELRKIGSGFQDEFKSAIDQPMREMRETADLMKNQIDPKKIAEDAERAVEAAAAAARADAELAAADASIDAVDELDDVGVDTERDDAGDFDDPFDDPIDPIHEVDPIDPIHEADPAGEVGEVDEQGGAVDDDASSASDAPLGKAGEPTTPSMVVKDEMADIADIADETMEESA